MVNVIFIKMLNNTLNNDQTNNSMSSAQHSTIQSIFHIKL